MGTLRYSYAMHVSLDLGDCQRKEYGAMAQEGCEGPGWLKQPADLPDRKGAPGVCRLVLDSHWGSTQHGNNYAKIRFGIDGKMLCLLVTRASVLISCFPCYLHTVRQ